MHTPWGSSQTVTRYACGVLFASTASHGGFHVPDSLLSRMPAPAQEYARRWSGSPNWYEEDCAYHLVRLAFPELVTEEAAERRAMKLSPELAEIMGNPSTDPAEMLEESRGACVAWCGPEIARAFGIDPAAYPDRLARFLESQARDRRMAVRP